MLKAVAVSIAAVLVLAEAAGAAGPELKTDEQKTLYALGLVIARNLTGFYLTKADLEVVEAGITDGILKTKPKADLETWARRSRSSRRRAPRRRPSPRRRRRRRFSTRSLPSRARSRRPRG